MSAPRSRPGSRALVLGLAAALVLAGALALGFYKVTRHRADSARSAYAAAFDAINGKLPAMVDKDTELDRIALTDDLITYRYRLVHQDGASMDPGFLADLEKKLPAQICHNRDIARFFEAGFRIRYEYSDRAHARIGAFDFEARDCR